MIYLSCSYHHLFGFQSQTQTQTRTQLNSTNVKLKFMFGIKTATELQRLVHGSEQI